MRIPVDSPTNKAKPAGAAGNSDLRDRRERGTRANATFEMTVNEVGIVTRLMCLVKRFGQSDDCDDQQ